MTENMKTEEYPVITGDKVILRPITMADTPDIVRWRNEESVIKNFIFREKFTEEMHTNWMKTKIASGETVQYIIIDKSSGASIGSVYFRNINKNNRSAEYGIFIGEESARGNGLGSETAKLFTEFGFDVLGLHRIFLRVLAGNIQAEKSYLNAGFEHEGIFRDMEYLDGKYTDVIFLAKLNRREI